MEVQSQVPFPLERDEDEDVGIDLVTKRKSHSQHTQINIQSISNSISDDGNITSVFSDSTFEYSTNVLNTTINGEVSKIIEGSRSVVGEAETDSEEDKEDNIESDTSSEDGKEDNFEMPNKGENGSINVTEKEIEALFSKDEGTNAYVQQNGGGVTFSLLESDAGIKEMDVGSNGSTLSKSLDTATGLKFVESLVKESSNHIDFTPSEISSAEQNRVNGIAENGQNEPAPEIAEFDVEGVLQKQETHDLYCPNCNSCITKRVILRRRKRKIPESYTDEVGISTKPDQTPPPPAPAGFSDIHVDESLQQVEEAPNARVEALTCFSCLHIIFPNGSWFPFGIFGSKPAIVHELGNAAGTSTEPPRDIALPVEEPSLHGEVDIHEQEILLDAPVDDGRGKNFPMWILTCCQPSMDGPMKPEETVSVPELSKPLLTSGQEVPPHEIEPHLPPSYGNEVPEPAKYEPPTIPDASKPSDNAPTVLLPTITPEPAKYEPPTIPDASKPSDDADTILPLNPVLKAPDGDLTLPSNPVPHIVPNGTPLPLEPQPPPKQETDGSMIVPKPQKPRETRLPVIDPSDDPVQMIDVEAQHVEPQIERPRPGVSGFDIIKAIVYGGLIEIITSLSVISSAAGGDATTLNIVALGLANVFGGLVLLFHNLRILKNEHVTEHYQEQLGRPGHFPLHATVAVISYLVFGMMPPMIYGFAYRESDDKNFKLATLAAASLVSIMVLSIGKAYVRNPPKRYWKTIFYYLNIGIMVSGLGYVAGQLTNELLKKLGVFDPHAPVTMPTILEAEAMKGAWSSY